MAESLFQKIGGLPAVSHVVRQFYRDVVASPTLKHHFEHIDMDSLIDHQTKFLSHALGGPADYTGRSLEASHKHLKITGEEFAEVAEILQETLEDAGVDDEDIETIMGVVGSTRPAIVSED